MTKKINYKLVPLWISIEKLTFKPKYELVPFWNEINLFINDLEYKKSEDFLLYRKINTFLCNGPAGTLYIIKKALGMQKLKVFISFLLDYINNESTPGHYFPSYVVLNQIEQIKTISNSTNATISHNMTILSLYALCDSTYLYVVLLFHWNYSFWNQRNCKS